MQWRAGTVVEQVRAKLPTDHVFAYSEVEPEPDEETIMRGVALPRQTAPSPCSTRWRTT